MSQEEQPVKLYLSEQTVAGSRVRWVTASDRDPIEAALQLTLEDLFSQIEGDWALYAGSAQPLPH